MSSVDVTEWEPADEEPLGTKPKQWLRAPNDSEWLWKESTIQNDARHGRFRKGDDWAEVVAARVGRGLELPVAEVQLATRGGLFGVISRKVVDNAETLVHGNEMLVDILGPGRHPHDRTGYTVEAVALALQGVGPPVASTKLATAFDWFAGYLVLDALVGNTDRHQDNWATIRSGALSRLSPSFDHASCLGFLLSDGERLERLDAASNGNVGGYARRARSKFEDHPSPLHAASSALLLASAEARTHWLEALNLVPVLDPMMLDVPGDRMSGAAKRFAAALYAWNHSALSHHLHTMCT